jgi:hypothetical protein
LLVGILGFAVAVTHPYVAEALKPPEPPPPKLSDTLAEAGDKLVGKVIDRVRGRKSEPVAQQPAPPPPKPWGLYLSIAATALGFIVLVSGTVGWVRREDHRLAASAMIAGFLAIAWVYIVVALVIALVLVFLLLILGLFS